jgi:hypothetical protein
LEQAWAALRAATPAGWYLGRPGEHPERHEWLLQAFDPSEPAIASFRKRTSSGRHRAVTRAGQIVFLKTHLWGHHMPNGRATVLLRPSTADRTVSLVLAACGSGAGVSPAASLPAARETEMGQAVAAAAQ